MNDSTLPEQNIAIDLDAVERKDAKPPFRAKIGDRVIEMKDPQDLDWRELLMMEDPREFIRLSFSEDDRDFLNKHPMEGWRFGKLMEAFYLHYDLEHLAEQARREQALGGGPRSLRAL